MIKVPHATDCSATALSGGGEKAVVSPNAATTMATVNLALQEIPSSGGMVTDARLCFKVPSSQGGTDAFVLVSAIARVTVTQGTFLAGQMTIARAASSSSTRWGAGLELIGGGIQVSFTASSGFTKKDILKVHLPSFTAKDPASTVTLSVGGTSGVFGASGTWNKASSTLSLPFAKDVAPQTGVSFAITGALYNPTRPGIIVTVNLHTIDVGSALMTSSSGTAADGEVTYGEFGASKLTLAPSAAAGMEVDEATVQFTSSSEYRPAEGDTMIFSFPGFNQHSKSSEATIGATSGLAGVHNECIHRKPTVETTGGGVTIVTVQWGLVSAACNTGVIAARTSIVIQLKKCISNPVAPASNIAITIEAKMGKSATVVLTKSKV